jgi:hypothetical protein
MVSLNVDANPRAAAIWVRDRDAYKWVISDDTCGPDVVKNADRCVTVYYAHIKRVIEDSGFSASDKWLRAQAMVLGATRAAITRSLDLSCADLYAHETVHLGSELGALAACGVHRVDTLMPDRLSIQFDKVEQNLVNVLVYAGPALPVLQGSSLAVSGFECSANTKGMFDMLLKRIRPLISEPGLAWIQSLEDNFTCLLYEIAAHPVHNQLKRELPQSVTRNNTLALVGFGL